MRLRPLPPQTGPLADPPPSAGRSESPGRRSSPESFPTRHAEQDIHLQLIVPYEVRGAPVLQKAQLPVDANEFLQLLRRRFTLVFCVFILKVFPGNADEI